MILIFTNMLHASVCFCVHMYVIRGPILKISSGTKQGPGVRHENEAVLGPQQICYLCTYIFTHSHAHTQIHKITKKDKYKYKLILKCCLQRCGWDKGSFVGILAKIGRSLSHHSHLLRNFVVPKIRL